MLTSCSYTSIFPIIHTKLNEKYIFVASIAALLVAVCVHSDFCDTMSNNHSTGRWYGLYRWRWFKNKGIAVTLLWSFAAFIVISSLLHHFTTNSSTSINHKSLVALAAVAISVPMFPLAGWLADVYVGRYRMISACLKIMWLGAILFSIKSALNSSILMMNFSYLEDIATLLLVMGISGFQANIIQFSLDQLFDSSSFEITSFILFYVWSYFAADLTVLLTLNCVCEKYQPIATLVLTLVLTLAVSSDFLFSHWLVKEPVSRNPLKLILQVFRYAAKNKYPRQRSAFTYWDDKHYSRIDLAKSKYGGPFTTEEVEDVKTFFQILLIVTVVCFFFGVAVDSSVFSHAAELSNFYKLPWGKCASKMIYPLAASIGLPLWEFLVFPILWKCITELKFLRKLGLGMMFILLYLISRASFDVYGQVGPHVNKNFTCPMSHTYHDPYKFSYWWLVLPNTFYGLGYCLIAVAGLQFVSAQCPYSMKGLMFGMVYLATGFSICLFYPLSLPFKRDGFHGWGGLNCIFWYQLACIVAALVIGVVFLIIISRYKNRQRDDNLPSQQFLADVYSEHMHTNNEDISMSVSLD